MDCSTIVFAIRGTFGAGTTTSPPNDEEVLKKWLNKLVRALKKLAGKSFESLPAIVRSIVGAVLTFLGRAVGFVA